MMVELATWLKKLPVKPGMKASEGSNLLM